MFVYNAKTKTNHISSKYLNKLKAKHLLITTLLQDVDRNTSDLLKNRTKFDEKIGEIKQNILSLFDEMGIVYDM
jgi:chorismate mutase